MELGGLFGCFWRGLKGGVDEMGNSLERTAYTYLHID